MNTEKNKQLMIQLLNGIKAMPYFKNYAAASGAVHNIASHEKAVEILMTDNGLTEWTPVEKPNSETVWNWINTSPRSLVSIVEGEQEPRKASQLQMAPSTAEGAAVPVAKTLAPTRATSAVVVGSADVKRRVGS
jgi:hypothetical protein